MTARDFCFWLQGYLELTPREPGVMREGMSPQQVQTIASHLSLVFRHEIDPSMGNKDHQDALNKIHNKLGGDSGGPVMRC